MQLFPGGLLSSKIQRDGFAYSFQFSRDGNGRTVTIHASRETVNPRLFGEYVTIQQSAQKKYVSIRTINSIMKKDNSVELLANYFTSFEWVNLD